MITITLNGTAKELPQIILLSDLISNVCPNPKHIMSEVNGAIIPSSQWSSTSIKNGDMIELVTFVGGG